MRKRWGPSKPSTSPFFPHSGPAVTARTTEDFTPSHNHVWAESDFTAVLRLQLSNHSHRTPVSSKIRVSHTSPASTQMLLLTALTTALASKLGASKIKFWWQKTSNHHSNFVILQKQGAKLEMFPFLRASVLCCTIHNYTKLTQHCNFYFSFLSSHSLTHSPWLHSLKPRIFSLCKGSGLCTAKRSLKQSILISFFQRLHAMMNV